MASPSFTMVTSISVQIAPGASLAAVYATSCIIVFARCDSSSSFKTIRILSNGAGLVDRAYISRESPRNSKPIKGPMSRFKALNADNSPTSQRLENATSAFAIQMALSGIGAMVLRFLVARPSLTPFAVAQSEDDGRDRKLLTTMYGISPAQRLS